MILYLIYLHAFSAFVSLGLFVLRALMQFAQKDWRTIKLLKILPHLSDTLLLVSGIIILVNFEIGFPWWIGAKIGLLISYIIFATRFFKAKQPHPLSFVLALIAFCGAILLGYYH
ncbi:SirB2 family protein [Avibacterium avium]|uniref:SirB2 family protein n=1 Tax=Avibacterium avium TaxID=751 RepID=UPI003BF7C724